MNTFSSWPRRVFIYIMVVLTSVVGLPFFYSPVEAAGEQIITTVSVKNNLNISRSNASVTWSVPLGVASNIRESNRLHLYRNGNEVPAQFTVLSRWGGLPADAARPIMWVLIDASTDLSPLENAEFILMSGSPSAFSSPLRIARNDVNGMVVETGAATYELSKTNFLFFDRITLNDGTSFAGNGGVFMNNTIRVNPATVTVEYQGAERISLRVHGTVGSGLEFTSRIHFYKNKSEVKVDFRLENLNSTQVENGQPNASAYGSPGSVNFDDLTIRIPSAASRAYTIPQGELGEGGERSGVFSSNIRLTQESSGDANWNAMRGMPGRLQSAARKRPSTLQIDNNTTDGPNQMAGWMDANNVTVAVERAWQNFPKSLRAAGNTVDVALFPGEYNKNFELRSGEFKTHTFFVRHHGVVGDVVAKARSFLSPLRFSVSPEYLTETAPGILLAGRMDNTFGNYEKGVDGQINLTPELSAYMRNGNQTESDERSSLLDSIATYGYYGMTDYGDIPTDFEGRFGPFNWKYDGLRGTVIQALRNMNNETWWELASAGAQHAADIDVHHSRVQGYNSNRGNFEGGLYGHTFHNENGENNPHRHAGRPETAMGGSAAGMYLYALLSGDTLVLDAATEVADNMYFRAVNSDYDFDVNGNRRGGRSIARAVGLQTCNDQNGPTYNCSGYESLDGSRIGGHFIQTMHMAYVATGDQNYLDIISRFANYLQRYETEVSGSVCDRFHMQTVFVKNLGSYLYLRDQLGFPQDTPARNLLTRRMDYMTGTLWDSNRNIVRTCYESGNTFREGYFENNWQLGAADSFAISSLVLNRPELLNTYARRSFDFGSNNIAWVGFPLGYNSTKEYVSQVGFGNLFLFAWARTNGGAITPPPPQPQPQSGPPVAEAPAPQPSQPAPSGNVNSITLEAEDMDRAGRNVVAAGDVVTFFSNGYVETAVNIPATGVYTVTIIARADLIPQRIANIRSTFDQVIVRNTSVPSATCASYSYERNFTSGNHTLRFTFTNDYYRRNGPDLNVHIDKIIITPLASGNSTASSQPTPSPSPAPAPSPQPPAPSPSANRVRVVLNPVADTFLYPNYGNVGKMSSVRLHRGQSDDNASRVILRFDTGSIPAQARVVSASLELYHLGSNNAYANSPRTVEVCAVSQNWAEGEGEYEYHNRLGANWTTTGRGVNWATRGGSCGASFASASLPFRGNGNYEEGRWMRFNLLNNWSNRYGFLLKSTGDDREDNFASREYNDTNLRPRLVIEYELAQ